MQEGKQKKCFKCGEIKLLSDFYKHPRMADGHVNKCKECNKKDVRENLQKNNEHYSAYDKERLKDKTSERYIKKLAWGREYHHKNKHKRSAQTKVSTAVRNGTLLKSEFCECCGSPSNIHAHHSSYSKEMWTVVTWLCGKCHVRLHKDFEYKLGPWSDAI